MLDKAQNIDFDKIVLTAENISEAFKNGKKFKDLMTCYSCAIMEVETKFKVLSAEFSTLHDRNPIESIKSRLKEPISIFNKLNRIGSEISLISIEEKLFDIAGVRVICSFIEDVYFLADCLAKQNDVEVIQIKDYIKNPKENGYRSYHMIIKVPIFYANEVKYIAVEIQFRTIAMDFWASLEHTIRYKKVIENSKEIEQELKECAVSSHEWDIKMQNLLHIIQNKKE